MYSHFGKFVGQSSSSNRLRVSIVAVVTLTILFLFFFHSDISPVSAGSPSRDATAYSRVERFAVELREYEIHRSDLGRESVCEICKVLQRIRSREIESSCGWDEVFQIYGFDGYHLNRESSII